MSNKKQKAKLLASLTEESKKQSFWRA